MVKNGDLFDILLLLKQTNIFGRKRLQKLTYLLQQRGGARMGYKFIPYYYGPYSHELRNDVDLLEALGLVESIGENPCEFSLTEKGQAFVEHIPREKLKNEEKIEKFVSKYGLKDTSELVLISKSLMQKKLGYNPWE